MKHLILALLISCSALAQEPPPPPTGTNRPPCWPNCTNSAAQSLTYIQRYGYHVFLQWSNVNQNPIAGLFWSDGGYSNACDMIPVSHVSAMSNGVPLQANNTNSFAHEVSTYTDGNSALFIWWAPNSYSNVFGYSEDLENWTEYPATPAPVNTEKDPQNPDALWPYYYWRPQLHTFGSSRGFYRLRRCDYGLGWTNACQ